MDSLFGPLQASHSVVTLLRGEVEMAMGVAMRPSQPSYLAKILARNNPPVPRKKEDSDLPPAPL